MMISNKQEPIYPGHFPSHRTSNLISHLTPNNSSQGETNADDLKRKHDINTIERQRKTTPIAGKTSTRHGGHDFGGNHAATYSHSLSL